VNGDFDTRLPRILCVSPVFVPTADPEAFCGAKMVQALRQCGAGVTVLTDHNHYRGAPKDDSRLWDSVRADSVEVPQRGQPNLLSSIAAALRFQARFYGRWVADVVKTARRLHQANPFDVVYSRSLPMVSHVAGFWCAKTLNLPWIANINDPWDFHFFPDAQYRKLSPFVARASMFWLKRTLQNADLVTYPGKGLRDFHTRLSGLDHASELIPHVGYRPEGCGENESGQFRLVHAGRLGATDVTGRSSRALLPGLKSFVDSSAEARARTKLVLVGPADKETQAMICELGLQENVETVGRVSYEASLNYIAAASACILLEADISEGVFFASKLADYLACGKPVLAISPRIGTAADLASRGELIRVDHDPGAIGEAIAALYTEFERGTLGSCSPSERLVTELQGPAVARQFLAACRSLTARPQSESWQRDRKGSWTRVRHSNDLSQS